MSRTAVLVAALLVAAPAAGSTWGGENGVVRLSFTQGDSLVSVTGVAAGAGGATLVDVWAYLDDVEPMRAGGELFTAFGGFELTLRIEGAEGEVVKQEFPFEHINIASQPGSCYVGINPGQKLQDGRAELVHWQIAFATRPENVTLSLDPGSLQSCKTMPGCVDSGTYALYTGTVDAKLMNHIFGAGCAPAYLNWTTPPEPQVRRGKTTWRDAGVMEAAQ